MFRENFGICFGAGRKGEVLYSQLGTGVAMRHGETCGVAQNMRTCLLHFMQGTSYDSRLLQGELHLRYLVAPGLATPTKPEG
jgi:hypothetical protein